MIKIPFKKASFVKTAVAPKDYPTMRSNSGCILPELAVVGRSNVGKSSLLNHLFHTKNLVKTSATPGKTQALNFFNVDDGLSCVDLPGYGFAKVPIAVRQGWGPMIQAYFKKRESLKLILFLFDIRRIPNEEDLELLEWMALSEKAVILVLTKVDKVNLKERRVNTQAILEAFNCENLHYVHFSTLKNMGRSELIRYINEALNDEAA